MERVRRFRYNATHPSGGGIEGTVEARDAKHAAEKVRYWYPVRLINLCIKEII